MLLFVLKNYISFWSGECVKILAQLFAVDGHSRSTLEAVEVLIR